MDNTSKIANKFKRENPDLKMQVIKNKRNRGLSRSYCDAAFLGSGKYFRLVCGDNSETAESIRKIVKARHLADMVLPYHPKVPGKSLVRKIISKAYTKTINKISGNNIQYYNGCALTTRYDVMRWGSYSFGFGFQADLITRLIKDADNMARYFTMWRGVFGALMPIPFAMRPEALAKSKDGNLLLATALWSDFKNIEKSVGDNKDKAYGQFIDTYGPEQIFAIVRTTAGYEPTNLPTYALIRENPSVLDKYPDVYGTFYPNGELSQVLYKFQQMQGSFSKMSASDIMKAVTNIRYKAAKDRLQARSVAEGWSSQMYDDAKKSLLESYYKRGYDPGEQDYRWRDKAIAQLKLAVEDESLVESEALMGARAYLVQRDKALAASGMKTFNNAASEPQREWLANEAKKLLAKYPDFQKIFYSYFKSELEG